MAKKKAPKRNAASKRAVQARKILGRRSANPAPTSFVDNQGQEWHLRLTLDKVREIRDRIGIDILIPQHYAQLQASLTDRLTYVYEVCRHEADACEIEADEFEERLYHGDIANKASSALQAACSDFFRRVNQESMAIVADKGREQLEESQKRIQAEVASGRFEEHLAKISDQMMTAAFGAMSSDSSESPDSEPAGTT